MRWYFKGFDLREEEIAREVAKKALGAEDVKEEKEYLGYRVFKPAGKEETDDVLLVKLLSPEEAVVFLRKEKDLNPNRTPEKFLKWGEESLIRDEVRRLKKTYLPEDVEEEELLKERAIVVKDMLLELLRMVCDPYRDMSRVDVENLLSRLASSQSSMERSFIAMEVLNELSPFFGAWYWIDRVRVLYRSGKDGKWEEVMACSPNRDVPWSIKDVADEVRGIVELEIKPEEKGEGWKKNEELDYVITEEERKDGEKFQVRKYRMEFEDGSEAILEVEMEKPRREVKEKWEKEMERKKAWMERRRMQSQEPGGRKGIARE